MSNEAHGDEDYKEQDSDHLANALQDVIEDLGTGKRKAEEATDTYFYGFEINGGK